MIKIAVNRVLGEDGTPVPGETRGPVIVALENDCVREVRPLLREEPFTMWIGGELRLRRVEGLLTAWRDGQRLDEQCFFNV